MKNIKSGRLGTRIVFNGRRVFIQNSKEFYNSELPWSYEMGGDKLTKDALAFDPTMTWTDSAWHGIGYKFAKLLEKAEESLRWRKWPEEKPTIERKYFVMAGNPQRTIEEALYEFGRFKTHLKVKYWLPIPELEER